MTTPVIPGPCNWSIDERCLPADWLTAYTEAQRTRSIEFATFILDALTGHQFTQCAITVRPCGPSCAAPDGYRVYTASAPVGNAPGTWMAPYVSGGSWRNCLCGSGCTCAPDCRVDLGVPVAEVTEVKVDGLVLDPSAYTLAGPWLIRIDGGECWPACQDASVPDTEEGTFSVTLWPGRSLPVAGRIAAAALAVEFAKACKGAECALPPQIASLTRQGVDVEFVDPTEILTEGRTGIREADLFIQAVNPSGIRRRSRVMSPDVNRGPVMYG